MTPYIIGFLVIAFLLYTSYNASLPQEDVLSELDELFLFRHQKAAYLKSPTWKEKRVKVLLRDRFCCKCCGTNKNLQVHHLSSYNKLGNEPLSALVTVCNDCHQHQHNVLGYPQTYQEYMNWNVKLVYQN